MTEGDGDLRKRVGRRVLLLEDLDVLSLRERVIGPSRILALEAEPFEATVEVPSTTAPVFEKRAALERVLGRAMVDAGEAEGRTDERRSRARFPRSARDESI